VRAHVGLNLVFLVPGQTGGMEVAARELIPELVAAAPEARFTAFVNRETAGEAGPWQDVESVTVPVRATDRLQWVRGEQLLLPRLARRAGVELLHSLGSTAPARGPFARVTTIHDLHYRIVPDAHFGVRGLGMRVLVPLAARRSHRLIAVSRSTRDDLVRLLGVPEDKVDVIPWGVGARAPAQSLPEGAVRDRYGLGDRPVVLSASAKRPHKNLVRLLEALAEIPAERRPVLVLPGYPTPHETELRARAGALGVTGDVRFLGWLEPAELEGLYATAAAFVFPSLYEGFGLPVLEAMARGVPVATSNRASLPEVAGDAALLFDPERPAEIAGAIETLLTDPARAERLRAAGRERAARFSWRAAAEATLDTYRRAMSGAASTPHREAPA
jgi:glycosyltransferase involved in cell wall biosynthesis